MSARGNLVVSTKPGAKTKIVQLVCCIIFIILGLIFIFNFKVFREIGDDLLKSETIGTLLGIVLIIFMFAYPAIVFIGNRSYCDVFEDSVVGLTGLSINHPSSPMQKFDIKHSEILNVTESGKTIFIYTQYTTYEVLATRNRAEAVNAIRARMAVQN